MSKSQNGWDAPGSSSSHLLYTWEIPTGPNGVLATRLRMRRGSIGLALAHFVLCFDAKVEDVDGGIMDDWAWAFRAVRGYSSTLSNHASGTAVDLNATQHPLGRDTMTSQEEATVHALLKRYDGLLRWGGDYKTRLDQMHIEVDDGATMAQMEKLARRLMTTPRGERILKANPSQRAVILS